MQFFKLLSIWLFAVLPTAFAVPLEGNVVARQAATTTRASDPACTNGPRSRACWSDGFSIATDFDAKLPPNGKTRTYNIEITNTTINADGSGDKLAMLIDKKYPGTTLFADWGDTLVINVKNSLPDNGTGIHWHGIRQLNTSQYDGANGVTECPIRPGETRQYKFRATQFGTTWYHSHFSAQYGDGVVGSIVINGPATANYDEDLGVLPLSDYFHRPAFTLNEINLHTPGAPIEPDNILVNGTHPFKLPSGEYSGKYFNIKVKKGKKYRLRLINTSVDAFFHVSLDGHPFQVITSDFVPIKPYFTNQIGLNIGQRYDVIINANQTSDNYWFRVGVGGCSGTFLNNFGKPTGAIFSYDDAPNVGAEPTTSGVTLSTSCDDEVGLTPWVPNTVPKDDFTKFLGNLDVGITTVTEQDGTLLVQWLINNSSIDVDWQLPTLQRVFDGSSDWGQRANVFTMDNANQWYFWIIQSVTPFPLPHPIHLHGHDFYEIGRGLGVYNGSLDNLTFVNPTRRDVATLPGGGYLIIGFPADNPGAWLMHCHIAWHVSQGLSLQFVERQKEIPATLGDVSIFTEGCKNWNEYWAGPHPYNKTDSGI